MTSVLGEILAYHRARAADDPRPTDALVEQARQSGPPRPFGEALAQPGLSVIAEVKRRSPSKGDIRGDLDAGELARAYAAGGAACISVLTDSQYFGGSMRDLAEVRQACDVPVLRKDFTVSPNDVCDARLGGADAVLLIVRALDRRELADLADLAGDLGLACLIEAHDEDEVEAALTTGARIVGINQRDLGDFSVEPDRASRLVKLIPEGVVKVAESGITSREDARRAADSGFDAALVGEVLVRSSDPTALVRELSCS